MDCAIENDLELDDGTPCGYYEKCTACTKATIAEGEEDSDDVLCVGLVDDVERDQCDVVAHAGPGAGDGAREAR